ncbi:hypothetical protein [Bacillus kwashiorkori]|uniref:hypothetical protein n=1 Tax=Bacillus kwashiorkori TaxID=1522318 RepID=UPI0007819FC2|nr:hypothetical protein [Bacillus kwashiorkori]
MILWFIGLSSIITAFSITTMLMNKYQKNQIEIDHFNTLYKCEKCGKFHRQYQKEIVSKYSATSSKEDQCPFCHGSSSLYTGKQYSWMKTNPDCPIITKKTLHILKRTLKKMEQIGAEDKSLEEFLKYYHLLPPPDNENKLEE